MRLNSLGVARRAWRNGRPGLSARVGGIAGELPAKVSVGHLFPEQLNLAWASAAMASALR